MTSQSASRFGALTPSLFFAAMVILAGCATQSPGPVAPISSGDPRVEPMPEEVLTDEMGNPIYEEGMEEIPTEVRGPYTPPHMLGRELVRAGVMLPFSDRRAGVRAEAEGMLAGIELALFDYAGENFVILPKDTAGSQMTSLERATDLVNDGADLVLGPLFSANVTASRDVFMLEGTPVVSFSNDSSVAGGGTYLASIAPEAEVAEIISYASLQGYDYFAFFGPQSTLGMNVEATMRTEVAKSGAQMVASAFYPADTVNPSTEAEYFATSIAAMVESGARIAVLVPERGNRLRRIAPLLAYYGVDTRQVKMLGTSAWNDAEVWREPSLKGAWFPAPPSLDVDDFALRFQRQYGTAPSALAAVAYDAAAMAIALSLDGALTADELTNPDGFAGVNGLFRFDYTGLAERSLAIMEIDPSSESGVRQVRSVAEAFTPPVF